MTDAAIALGYGLAAARACRFCGCTETRACPGGCSWAFDDVCTACLGHTPASWAALQAVRMQIDDTEIRPPFVCLIAGMSYACKAVDDIASSMSQHALRRDDDLVADVLANLLLATIEVMEAGGYRPEHNQLLGAIEKFREEDR